MKSGQLKRTMAEAEYRYRGIPVAHSRTDPRLAQIEMDEEARWLRSCRLTSRPA